jgi:hypothetical protein
MFRKRQVVQYVRWGEEQCVEPLAGPQDDGGYVRGNVVIGIRRRLNVI